jgi:hypothetical protein
LIKLEAAFDSFWPRKFQTTSHSFSIHLVTEESDLFVERSVLGILLSDKLFWRYRCTDTYRYQGISLMLIPFLFFLHPNCNFEIFVVMD